MAEACVEEKRGTYLFCDTDSLAVVASKDGGSLCVPGSDGVRILSWSEVQAIVDRFAALNPYNRRTVKGSILNLVDANYVDSDPENPRRQFTDTALQRNVTPYTRESARRISDR